MSYAITYGPRRSYEAPMKKGRTGPILAGVALVLALGTVLLFRDGVQVLRQALCPWMHEGMAAAAQSMIRQVQEGMAPVDALAVFCRELIGLGAV